MIYGGIMVENKLLLIFATTFITIFYITSQNAVVFSQAPTGVNLYLATDRSFYVYGETGTLLVDIYNGKDESIILTQIYIEFSWFGLINGKWDGNQTWSNLMQNVTGKGGVIENKFTFNVPSEMRRGMGETASVDVRVYYNTSSGESSSVTGSLAFKLVQPVTSVYLILGFYLQIVTVIGILIATGFLGLTWYEIKKRGGKTSEHFPKSLEEAEADK
jgi:hypothetical protein